MSYALTRRRVLERGAVAAAALGLVGVVGCSSGNNNNGTISNATWTSSGKYGSALSFNGGNALVTIPDSASLDLTSGMTLEAWVKPSVVDGAWRDVIYKGDDRYCLEGMGPGRAAAGLATFSTGSPVAYGTSPMPGNTWTHIALTYDGGALRLYVNGVQVSSVAVSGSIRTSSNPLQIGGDSIYGQYFAGIIDEVRVYNVALTAAQIQADMSTAI